MSLPNSARRLPFHDPQALAELVGDARVVALGENNHQIHEFLELRNQILRVLVTELGFGVVAFESGFPEGRLVDDWIRGDGDQRDHDVGAVARDGFTFRLGEAPEVHDMMSWMRAHNAAGGRLRFAGVDVPGSAGSALTALHRVREYLAAHAPDEIDAVDAAIRTTDSYAAANNSASCARYAELDASERDAATTSLARLLLRLDALPGRGSREHAIARHHALGALRVDEHQRELTELAEQSAPALVRSSRDVYQAATVRLLRRIFGPDERIALMMHNGHVQRTPLELIPGIRARSAGNYLATDLGEDYRVLGITAVTGTTTDLRLNEHAREGFEVLSRPLDPPDEHSVERAVADVSPEDPVLLDLRPVRGDPGPSTIRHAWTHMSVDVARAFDALACLPRMRPSSHISSPDAGTAAASPTRD